MRVCIVALLLGAVSGCASSGPTEPTRTDAPASQRGPDSAPVAASLHAALSEAVRAAEGETAMIAEDRRAALDRLAAFIVDRRRQGQPANLLFICTHNSRRSHMAQLWAKAAAVHHGVEGVETFSGGTEATAFNPRAVAALQRAGFSISPETEGQNPRYFVSLGPALTVEAFSKRFGDPPNPTNAFAAVMTCSDADEACPFVPGADFRVAVPYVDPKVSDGTPRESETYDARSAQIAVEMAYVFSRVRAHSS